METQLADLLKKHGLLRIKPILEKYILPCVAFDLNSREDSSKSIISKLGGKPDLPKDFVWFKNKERPLEFLLQIDLSEASKYDQSGLLPKKGLLSFFYDLEDQPWGFDPQDLNGYKVVYSSEIDDLKSWDLPNSDYNLKEFELSFQSGTTIPYIGSADYALLEQEAEISKEYFDKYWDFADEFSITFSSSQNPESMEHRLLGYSKNVQGDMQVEAQLVMNGYYYGKPFENEDPVREKIKEGYKDWILLLQLDSDDKGDFMWGDSGMLYFWIRKQDLIQKNFDNVWMTLQCH